MSRLVSRSKGGPIEWELIAAQLCEMGFQKCGKQVRERWVHHLDPRITRNPLTVEEARLLFALHSEVGPKWKLISRSFPSRTDNNIKNQFFAHVRKSLRRAKKLVPNPSEFDSLGGVKPLVLSLFINKEFRLDALESVRMPDELTWLRNPLRAADFVGFFAFARHSAIVSHNSLLSAAACELLRLLQDFNSDYCRKKHKITAVFPPQKLPSCPRASTRLSARSLLFFARQLTRNAENRSLTCPDAAEIFQKIAKSADNLASSPAAEALAALLEARSELCPPQSIEDSVCSESRKTAFSLLPRLFEPATHKF